MDVVWTDQARDKLLGVVALIAEDRPEAARRLANRLFDRADSLGDFPDLGRPYELLPGMGLRLLVEPPYGLVYRVQGDPAHVMVLALRHQREPVVSVSDLPAPEPTGETTGAEEEER